MEELRLAYDDEVIETVEKEQFKVVDLQSADWCFKKIQKNNREAQEQLDYIELEELRLAKYKQKVIYKRDTSNQHLEGLLEEYYQDRKAEDPRFSLKTITGSVSSRKSKSWDYDNELVLNYLKENHLDQFIRIKEEINKADFKKSLTVKNGKAITSDGEVVPGIEITENEKITVKVSD